MSIITEIQASIDNCIVGIDQSTREGKAKAINASLDLFASWRDQDARNYQAALETGVDLSPRAFDAIRNCRISVQ